METFNWRLVCCLQQLPSRLSSRAAVCGVDELGLCNLSLEFSLTHVVVAESSFGWPWWSIVDWIVLCGWLVTMIWGGKYIKFIVGLNPTRLDSSVVRASGICPEGLGSIPSLVTFLYSNTRIICTRVRRSLAHVIFWCCLANTSKASHCPHIAFTASLMPCFLNFNAWRRFSTQCYWSRTSA